MNLEQDSISMGKVDHHNPPPDFVALDFETATSDRASPCAIGLALVSGNRVVKTRSRLIQPPRNEFDGYNSQLHGIYPSDTRDAPTFADLWPEIQPHLEHRLVTAHYAAFDLSVLRHTLDRSGQRYPSLKYLCTHVLAKQAWPDRVNYRLDWISEDLGIEFEHHDAGEDARACAELALRCQDQAGTATLRDTADHFDVRIGQLSEDGYTPSGHRSTWNVSDIEAEDEDFDPRHPFFQKTVVFTGALESMVRREAMQEVVNAGGNCTSSVSGNTDYLVVGDQDLSQFREGQTKSRKMQKAEKLAEEGTGIELLAEEDFLRMIAAR